MRTHVAAFAWLSVGLISAGGTAEAWDVQSKPSVVFYAVGPAGLRFRGKSHKLTVKETAADLQISVPLGELKTGLDLRDKHMREKYLEVAKYPQAVLMVERSSFSMPADGKETRGKVVGLLTLHGKSRRVAFNLKMTRKGSLVSVLANLPLRFTDFGIVVPSYLGVTVRPDVEVVAEFVVRENSTGLSPTIKP